MFWTFTGGTSFNLFVIYKLQSMEHTHSKHIPPAPLPPATLKSFPCSYPTTHPPTATFHSAFIDMVRFLCLFGYFIFSLFEQNRNTIDLYIYIYSAVQSEEPTQIIYVHLYTHMYDCISCSEVRPSPHPHLLQKIKEYHRYDSKLHQVIRRKYWSSGIFWLLLLPGPLWPKVRVPIMVPSMSQIELFENYLYLI